MLLLCLGYTFGYDYSLGWGEMEQKIIKLEFLEKSELELKRKQQTGKLLKIMS